MFRCSRASRLRPRGWALVGCIVLVSSVILALAGITFFVTEHLRSTSLTQNATRAVYLAQAGLMQAAYDFRFSAGGNGFAWGTFDAVPGDAGAPGLADDDVFTLGGQMGDILLAAMIPSTIEQVNANPGGGCSGSPRHRLINWTLRNVSTTNAVTFDRIAVTWSGAAAGEGVLRIDLNGTTRWLTSGCVPAASGAALTLSSPQTINPVTFWGANHRIWFSTTTMNAKSWIELAFFMTDPSSSVRRARFLPSNARGSSASFTIKSIGEVRQGAFPFIMRRRLQAEYRLNDADTNVSDLQEIGRLATDTALLLDPAAPAVHQRPGYQELSQQTP